MQVCLLYAARCSVFLLLVTLVETAVMPSALSQDSSSQDGHIAAIDTIVEEGLDNGDMPGVVVMVGTTTKLLHFRAYGLRQVEPTQEEMTRDTIFDLASLTKPIACATSVMILVDEGKVDPELPVMTYLPEFGANGKDQITVRQLLTHVSGLIADNAIGDYADGPDAAWENICGLSLKNPPGEEFTYSDVGFIVLGKLVERMSATPLDEFARTRIYEPLGMSQTGYRPVESSWERIAPTEKIDGEFRRGQVHDPRAFAMGGVAGHAGLFSNAEDLAKYARMILMHGQLTGTRIFSEETWQLMLTPREVPRGSRAYGWDHHSGYSSNRGDGMSEQAVGHGGFTGTGIWIDPEKDLFVIWLSNRLHPDGKGVVNKLIGRVGTVAVQSLAVEN